MMRKIIFALTLTIAFELSNECCGLAQNVGIGTPTPVFKLDVRNGSINTDSAYRIGGKIVLSVKGIFNTFVGVDCGNKFNSSLLTGNNTALGHAALQLDSTGAGNTAVGESALAANIKGYSNTACGANALFNNNANNNTALGNLALAANTQGQENVGCGYAAAEFNIDGNDNTAVGTFALSSTSHSDGNTAVGWAAGGGYNNGFYNTFLGMTADANGPGLFNSVAIGAGATVTAPLQVRIGNTLINSIGGYQGWTTFSDGRYKQNIREDVKGLEFIRTLRPVTYTLNISAIREMLNENRMHDTSHLLMDAIAAREREVHSGFIAQEVEKAMITIDYNFSGVDKPKNENDFYGLRYGEFVVPLVKAVQEQQQQIDSLSAIFSSRQGEFNELKKRIEALEQLLIHTNSKSSSTSNK